MWICTNCGVSSDELEVAEQPEICPLCLELNCIVEIPEYDGIESAEQSDSTEDSYYYLLKHNISQECYETYLNSI